MSIHRLSIVLAILTFGLIVWGGHVNTTNSGMAFPDWPTSNANAMLTYAPSQWLWQGDRFWEHGHRLFATLVGSLTVLLAGFAWKSTPKSERPNPIIALVLVPLLLVIAAALIGIGSMAMSVMLAIMTTLFLVLLSYLVDAFRHRGARRILSLCIAAFAGVCLQGFFGGFTVRNNLPDWTSTTHGMLAELFFTIVLAIAWLTRKSSSSPEKQATSPAVKGIVITTWMLVLVQFLLGALTRHTSSWGVSSSWPTWDSQSMLPSADQWQHSQVVIHFIHRTLAYAVALFIIVQALVVRATSARRLAAAQVGLVILQIALGAGIIFTARGELTTTAHVMIGVVLLATSSWMSFPFVLQGSIKHSVEERRFAGARI